MAEYTVSELEELTDEELREEAKQVNKDIEATNDKEKLAEAMDWAVLIAAEVRRRFEVDKCKLEGKWN